MLTRKRRYMISAAVLAACVCLALGVLAMLPHSGPTKADYLRIEDRMTRSEVLAILGEPTHYEGSIHCWNLTDGYFCMIGFNDEGKATQTMFKASSHETIPDKLRRWLGLPASE